MASALANAVADSTSLVADGAGKLDVPAEYQAIVLEQVLPCNEQRFPIGTVIAAPPKEFFTFRKPEGFPCLDLSTRTETLLPWVAELKGVTAPETRMALKEWIQLSSLRTTRSLGHPPSALGFVEVS